MTGLDVISRIEGYGEVRHGMKVKEMANDDMIKNVEDMRKLFEILTEQVPRLLESCDQGPVRGTGRGEVRPVGGRVLQIARGGGDDEPGGLRADQGVHVDTSASAGLLKKMMGVSWR